MAEGDSAALFPHRFLEKFQLLPENTSRRQSIYKIPSLLRDLDPNAYVPRVVSIGPYHHGKEQLQEMEEQKLVACNIYLRRYGCISLDDIIAEFKGEEDQRCVNIVPVLMEVRNCYTWKLEWSDDHDFLRLNNSFLRLMVLDGCFLLELLLDDRTEKHALLSYVKMDMLVLDNQIPLFFLRELASIIAKFVSNRPSATLPTGSENVTIQVENLNINQLIWKFYGNLNDDIPANRGDAHHVLDAYREGCIRTGTYDGWASSQSVRELFYHGVEFRASSGGGVADGFVAMGSFKDVAFKVSDDNFIRLGDRLFNIFEPSDQSQNGQTQKDHQNNQNGQAQR